VRSIAFVFLITAAAAVPAAAQSLPQVQTPPPAAVQQPGQPPTPPGQASAAAQTTAVPAVRRFTSDAGMMFSLIKPDKTADFEAVMARVKEALGKSQDPKRKQQAQNWVVFKATEPAMGGNVLYIWWMDPPAKDADYTISSILAEAFPTEVQDLWAKYTACFVSGQTMLNLTVTTNMSPTAAPIVK
jgi:hypothetical protein